MDLLLSFCNLSEPGSTGLGLLDVETFDFRIPRPAIKLLRCVGITGLATSEQYVYAVIQGCTAPEYEWTAGRSILITLDITDLSLISYYVFQQASDVHSILAEGDTLNVASTGTDEVIRLRMRGPEVVSESVLWRLDSNDSRPDLNHLNAIYNWRGELLVSGFGRKTSELWSSADNGFIININSGQKITEGIYHPHSMNEVNDTLAFCESSKGAVRFIGEDRNLILPGYTRGLCVDKDSLFVGTSMGRQVSKSTGIINNVADPGVATGKCSVSCFSTATLTLENSIDLTDYANEIYDIVPVYDTELWPVVTRL